MAKRVSSLSTGKSVQNYCFFLNCANIFFRKIKKMHFCNASWTILANYACINWAMLGKKQGVYSYFLILLHPLLYFEVGRHSRVGALEIFSSPFFFLPSLFGYLGMFFSADCIRVFLSSFPGQSDCPLFYRLPLLVRPLSNASASPFFLWLAV